MSEMLRRLERLPREMTQGHWTACEVAVDQGRIRFSEMAAHAALRLRERLRRRMRWLGGGTSLLLVAALVPVATARAALAIAGLAVLLGGVEGLRHELRGRGRRFELAVLDPYRDEVELLGPQGSLLYAPLSEVKMFLLVTDAAAGRSHVALVSNAGAFLPWISSPAGPPATSLTWLLGHLSGRPAMQLEAPLDLAMEHIDQALPIPGPVAPES